MVNENESATEKLRDVIAYIVKVETQNSELRRYAKNLSLALAAAQGENAALKRELEKLRKNPLNGEEE